MAQNWLVCAGLGRVVLAIWRTTRQLDFGCSLACRSWHGGHIGLAEHGDWAIPNVWFIAGFGDWRRLCRVCTQRARIVVRPIGRHHTGRLDHRNFVRAIGMEQHPSRCRIWDKCIGGRVAELVGRCVFAARV